MITLLTHKYNTLSIPSAVGYYMDQIQRPRYIHCILVNVLLEIYLPIALLDNYIMNVPQNTWQLMFDYNSFRGQDQVSLSQNNA